jgi:hypothetical protein
MLKYIYRAPILVSFVWIASTIASQKQKVILANPQLAGPFQNIVLTPCEESPSTLTRLVLEYIGKDTPRLTTRRPYKVHKHSNELQQFSAQENPAVYDRLKEILATPFSHSTSYISSIDLEGNTTVFVTHVRGDKQNQQYLSYCFPLAKDLIAENLSHINHSSKDMLRTYAISRTKQQERTARVERLFGAFPENTTDASFFPQLGTVVAHNEQHIKFWQTTTNHAELAETLTEQLLPFLSEPPKQ